MGISSRQPIHKISHGDEPHTHEGFCHEINLVIGENGNITPNNINLGNKGDKNITRLIFDYNILKTLDIADQDLEEYNHVLFINDGTITVRKTPEVLEDGYSTFVISEDICARPIRYTFIYALEEIDDSTGNIEKKEVFISDMFSGSVTNTDWDPILEEKMNVLEENDVLEHLSKPDIILVPSDDHYIIAASDFNLGNKCDKYMKRLTFDDRYNDLDEGLDERYCIYFKNNVLIKVTKFLPINANSPTMTSWIPEEITNTAGYVNLMIVARTCDKTQRWVSNTLVMNVQNNFLEDGEVEAEEFLVLDENEQYEIFKVRIGGN